jgi:hypothetical protein
MNKLPIKNSIQAKSGKSCGVTIPYVEVNSTTKFALECKEGLIMTLNSNKCAICMSRCLFLASQSLQRLNIDTLTFTKPTWLILQQIRSQIMK